MVRRPISLLSIALSILAVLMCSCIARAEDMVVTAVNRQSMEIASNRHVHPYGEIKPIKSTLDTTGFELVVRTDAAELWLSRSYHALRIVDLSTGYVWGAIPLEGARNLNTSWKSYAGSIVSIEVYDAKNIERRYGLLGNAAVDYRLEDDGFEFSADYKELGIAFTGSVRLVGNRVTFELKDGSLVEKGSYRLKSLAFVPFLGSVFGDEIEGWFLLPDGPGALMRFRAPGSYVAGYDNRVYGADLAVSALSEPQSLGTSRPNDYVIPPNQVLVPVYGIVHGIRQNGILSVIESGEQYASIVATPAGLNNMRYNSIMVRFDYRQSYSRSATRSGAGALVPQEEMNVFTPRQSLYLLSGDQADYDQMAVFYRNLLIASGTLSAAPDKAQDRKSNAPLDIALHGAPDGVPGDAHDGASLQICVLGADVRQMALWKAWRTFTTLDQVKDIVEQLQTSGVRDLQVVLRNYTEGNATGRPLNSRLGSMQELDDLQALVSAHGGSLLMYLDPVRANKDQINLRLQAAHTMSKSPIRIWRDNPTALYQDTYLFSPDVVERATLQHLEIFRGIGMAVDQLGSSLYGDYSTGRESTRAENAQRFLSLVRELGGRQGHSEPSSEAESGDTAGAGGSEGSAGGRGDSGGEGHVSSLAMYVPNQLVWPYVDSFLDFPLVSGQYLYETDTVPFLPIILKGSMTLYSPPLNTGFFGRDRLLRMVEYGVNPSFVVTAAESIALAGTASGDFHSTCFNDWRDYILEAYRYVQTALDAVAGLRIIAHTAVDLGRVQVTYENGVIILINYTADPWESEHGLVLPHDYLVIERGGTQ